ncbi:MAG: hypothetical protein EXR36_08375 [Betaproteobacteria bacterium]|nr:hypothetical protein [Betaproteobacteria bacterium]
MRVAEWASAIGTVAVAIMAIWGEKVRAFLAPPELLITKEGLRGSATRLTIPGVTQPSGGTKAIYYHLKVVNLRPWLTVQSCRVLLKGIARRYPTGEFQPIYLPVPLQFRWANEGDAPSRVVVTRESVLNFGQISEDADQFVPLLYVYPNNFEGHVGKGEAVRFDLEIDASHYVPKKCHVVEVAWDGQWEFYVANMERHLVIREIA